jgi:hypothetical protein
VAREIAESRRRKAQARADFAVDRVSFPRLTKRFADAHPEAVAAIREISRRYRLARDGSRFRQHDCEHQEQLMVRREALLREAWAVWGAAGEAAS